MLCNLCQKNPATVHLTEIVDDQMSELHLCDDCARKKSIQMEQQFGLSDLLGGLVEYGKQLGGGAEKQPAALQCGACGLTYEDFRKIGRLGCGECYKAFSKQLGALLKRIHGASRHVGKVPAGVAAAAPAGTDAESGKQRSRGKTVDIDELKVRLQEAIKNEAFEDAAHLRDMIKEIERRKKGGSEST
ncbi:MAG: UvrB/UvrC motif-containing protein [Deltaproteobacteria bacterium]